MKQSVPILNNNNRKIINPKGNVNPKDRKTIEIRNRIFSLKLNLKI